MSQQRPPQIQGKLVKVSIFSGQLHMEPSSASGEGSNIHLRSSQFLHVARDASPAPAICDRACSVGTCRRINQITNYTLKQDFGGILVINKIKSMIIKRKKRMKCSREDGQSRDKTQEIRSYRYLALLSDLFILLSTESRNSGHASRNYPIPLPCPYNSWLG